MLDPNNGERFDLRESITALGLQYRLMTQFTSFVAVEEKIITDGTTPRRVDVPVEMPEGASHDGVFGGKREEVQKEYTRNMQIVPSASVAISASPEVQVAKSKASRGDIARGAGGNYPPPKPVPTAKPTGRIVEQEASRDKAPVNAISSNLHPAILAAINGQGGSFIHNGKAEIQIWLLDKTEANVQKLRQLGFEVTADPSGSKLIIGKIAVDKLSKLAQLQFIRFIAPYQK